MVKILVTEPESYDEKCVSALKNIGKVIVKKVSRKELLNSVKDIDVLVVRLETNVDRELLERAKKLKIIGTATTGTDHINLEYAKKRGIRIISLKDTDFLKTVNASVEHTFALTFGLIRKIPWAFDSMRREKWSRDPYFGTEIYNKTLGIIGFGRIGTKVAKIAKEFGSKIIFYDPYVDLESMDKIGAKKVSLEELLQKSDIISIHAELTPETEDMISYKEFSLMKRHPILVNTSRGKIVNEEALLDALENNIIKGAALDVIQNEVTSSNPLRDNPLINYAKKNHNLLITPHIAGSTYESMQKTGIFIMNKIYQALKY